MGEEKGNSTRGPRGGTEEEGREEEERGDGAEGIE